jgi:hypothetical protein
MAASKPSEETPLISVTLATVIADWPSFRACLPAYQERTRQNPEASG